MSEPRPATSVVFCLIFFLATRLPLQVGAAPTGLQLSSAEQQQLQREARIVVDLLQNHHYSGRAFREIDNKEMVGRFLNELDPGGDFLTEDDIQLFHRRFDRTLKSVYLFRGDLQPAFEIFDAFSERARTRLKWVESRLGREFDPTRKDIFEDSPRSEGEILRRASDEDWEKRLQDALLSEILSGRTSEEASDRLRESFAEVVRQIGAVDSFAVRERFFDSVIRSFDPHSGYFSADSSREFETQMENAIVGVGVSLHKEAGRCVVSAIEPGGPADLHSAMAPGDTIVALAEGDGPWSDVSRKPMREIGVMMRGESIGKLRIAYQPAGTKERVETSLERVRVTLTSDRAHGAISLVPDASGTSRRVGWIMLPSFYASGDGSDTSSASRDVRELLDQMVEKKIESLVIDLRTNPGGALTEAAALSQLFLPGGTMMVSRGLNGISAPQRLKDAPAAYTGPLVVLISNQSASASEIFAGAIKHYRRGLIVGDVATFGKGTSQTYVQLAHLPNIDPRDAKEWGTLRVTTESFYLPNGQALQRVGVGSQIAFPASSQTDLPRESLLPHALPEATVPAPVEPVGAMAGSRIVSKELEQDLRQQAERNVRELPEWELWRRMDEFVQARLNQRSRSLNLEIRRREWMTALSELQSLVQRRRALLKESFPTDPVETAAVQTAYAAHEKQARSLKGGTGETVLRRLYRGGFFVETDHGRMRELRLATLDVRKFFGDAEELAAAFSIGAGRAIDGPKARQLLETLPLLPQPTDAAFVAAAQKLLGAAWSNQDVRAGLEAMLGRLTDLDPELVMERSGLDIPLRESLRIGAEWSRLRADASGR